MKTLILLTIVFGVLYAQSDEDSVLELLNDLKHNAELEVEGMDLAWQRRLQDKQDQANTLSLALLNQRSQCQAKNDDLEAKIFEQQTTNTFINWMISRQKANLNRIEVLEANLCAMTNNFIEDQRTYRIVLNLVTFLKSELTKISGGSASMAEIKHFNTQVHRFMKLYTSGKMMTMLEKVQIVDGQLLIPDVESTQEQDEQELFERLKPKVFAQIRGTEDPDNSVVLIPNQCDGSVGTVVVVQNGDESTEDLKINFKQAQQQQQQQQQKHKQPKTQEEEVIESLEHLIEGGDEEESEDAEEEVESEEEGVDEEESEEEGVVDGESEEQTEEESNQGEESKPTLPDETGQHTEHHIDEEPPVVPPSPKKQEAKPEAEAEEEEDFPNTPEGFRKLLDAIYKHTTDSIKLGFDDEIRSRMAYIDFKIHLELENTTFDKNIAYQSEYLNKLNNMITAKQQAVVLCTARENQLQIAHQIALRDIDAAEKFYQEQRKAKVEEVNTFDDVYRIYVNQVKQ